LFYKACSFWLNFCTSSFFFLFFLGGKKRKEDELVQKFRPIDREKFIVELLKIKKLKSIHHVSQ